MLKNRIDVDDLYFGVKVWNSNKNELETINLFDIHRIKYSVAKWVLMDDEARAKWDASMFLFGEVWSRTQFEFIACPWPYGDNEKISDHGQKIDTFSLYVEPNLPLLLDLISRVTKASARWFLKNNKW